MSLISHITLRSWSCRSEIDARPLVVVAVAATPVVMLWLLLASPPADAQADGAPAIATKNASLTSHES